MIKYIPTEIDSVVGGLGGEASNGTDQGMFQPLVCTILQPSQNTAIATVSGVGHHDDFRLLGSWLCWKQNRTSDSDQECLITPSPETRLYFS